MNKFKLKLYITGRTSNSIRAIETLQGICEENFADEYELSIIDVLEHPQLAEDEKILATPTLIKELPPPMRRIIGDLSNTERVLLGMDMLPVKKSNQKEK
jgi:circadian clock protein KaiB